MSRLALAATLALALTTTAHANMPPPEHRAFLVITELAAGGTLRCEGREDVWSDLYPMAGFTPLEVGFATDWRKLEGKVVRLRAREPSIPRLTPTLPMPCQEQQMRSDWVFGPRGFRQDRGDLRAPSPTLIATDLEPWEGLRLTRVSDAVEVSLENRDIGVDLVGLRVVAHYEGCGKKPGATHERSTPFDLPMGANKTLSFPATLAPPATPPDERPPTARREAGYRLDSIQVIGGNDLVLFLLDRDLGRAGVPVRCPER